MAEETLDQDVAVDGGGVPNGYLPVSRLAVGAIRRLSSPPPMTKFLLLAFVAWPVALSAASGP